MGNFLSKMMVLLAKEETTYGQDANPAISNALEVRNLKVSEIAETLDRDLVRQDLSPVAHRIGQRHIELTFESEVKWSGTKGVVGRLGDLIEACGFYEGVSAGSSVTYTPTSGTIKSLTFYVYEVATSGNWRLRKILGARGDFNLIAEAGQIARFAFTFKGLWQDLADVSSPGIPTYETTSPPIVESGQLTLNGVNSLVAQSVEINLNNNLILQDDINSPAGVKGFVITGRRPTLKFNPEAVLKATYNFRDDWKASTERQISLTIGSVDGNKLTITCPKVAIESIASGDREGQIIEEITFLCAKNQGDDEINLKFI